MKTIDRQILMQRTVGKITNRAQHLLDSMGNEILDTILDAQLTPTEFLETGHWNSTLISDRCNINRTL